MIRLFCLLILSSLSLPALAHKNSDSYLIIDATAAPIAAKWSIAIRDIDLLLPLDSNKDGNITWAELSERQQQIYQLAFANLTLQRDSKLCAFSAGKMQVEELSDGQYAVLNFTASCPSGNNLTLGYKLLFTQDPNHRGLVNAQLENTSIQSVLSPSAPFIELSKGPNTADTAWRFFREGVWHIWIGFDHLIFLFTLLLPAVLVYRQARWLPSEHLGDSLKSIAAVVTAFTVAHSMTLSVAALGWLSLPSRWVEAAIAASIVLAALNNLRPVTIKKTWLLAFILGLIHGFGFAGVLGDLGLQANNLILPLLTFNIGVEIGQLAVVATIMPLAWWLRRSRFYRVAVLYVGSLVAAAIGVYWCVERLL